MELIRLNKELYEKNPEKYLDDVRNDSRHVFPSGRKASGSFTTGTG